jgi:flagellar protein FliL
MTTPEITASDKAKGPSIIVLAGVLLVLSGIAGGGGWYLGGMLAPEPVVETATPEGATGETAEAGVAAANLVDLEPITTNLSYPSDNWVRMEVSLLFATPPADTTMATTIHQDILAYLRTVSLQQIDGPRGFQHLREDLVERVALRSDGQVTDLLFRTFIVE